MAKKIGPGEKIHGVVVRIPFLYPKGSDSWTVDQGQNILTYISYSFPQSFQENVRISL